MLELSAEPLAESAVCMHMDKSRAAAPALAAAFFGALLASCAPQPAAVPADSQSAQARSILVASTPAAGSTVAAPVNELVLRFSPPAALNEVTITGPEGTIPTMIAPAGETDHYTIPLSGLGPGSYTVRWRASASGRQYEGSFGFSAR